MKSGKATTCISKSQQAYRWCLGIFIITGSVVILLFPLLLFNTGAFAITAWLKIKPWLMYWRLGLFLSLVGGWPYWVSRYAHWAKLDSGQQHFLRHYRWRFALILLMIEAILVQGVFVEVLP
jgi:hypothetical protein